MKKKIKTTSLSIGPEVENLTLIPEFSQSQKMLLLEVECPLLPRIIMLTLQLIIFHQPKLGIIALIMLPTITLTHLGVTLSLRMKLMPSFILKELELYHQIILSPLNLLTIPIMEVDHRLFPETNNNKLMFLMLKDLFEKKKTLTNTNQTTFSICF